MATAPILIGLDLTAVMARFDALDTSIGELMTTQAEALAAITAKVDDIRADFAALLAQLAAERENLTEAGQAALDAATASLASLDEAVGDADGSDTPAPEPTPEPAPVEVPVVDETPAPAEGEPIP